MDEEEECVDINNDSDWIWLWFLGWSLLVVAMTVLKDIWWSYERVEFRRQREELNKKLLILINN